MISMYFFLTEPFFNKLFSLYDTFDLIFHEIPSKDDKNNLQFYFQFYCAVESFPGFLGFRIGRFFYDLAKIPDLKNRQKGYAYLFPIPETKISIKSPIM